MIHVLIYDIESDKVRAKVAKVCEEYGLERVQYSAFWGQLSDNECEELLLRCAEVIGDEAARIHVLPVCQQCFARRSHYATGVYEGLNEAPRQQGEPIIFLPDKPPTRPQAAKRTGTARQINTAERPEVRDALLDVARRRPRDKPLGPDEDPWGEQQ